MKLYIAILGGKKAFPLGIVSLGMITRLCVL